jgi:lipid-A-disaccharide synthase
MRIGIVAGEASGDLLGAGLMAAVKGRYPTAAFEGVGGPRMVAEGCRSLFPVEKLAVMGFAEVLRHLPGVLRIRGALQRHFLECPPDVFVGIDSPDFNLPLEERLKANGVRTVHYVSPTVWAWRRSRMRTIARSVDLMLTLLPFEAAFYHAQRIPVRFVGHPLADRIPPTVERAPIRAELGLPHDQVLVALLPGSRVNELHHLAVPLVQAAAWCCERRQDLHFVVPLWSEATRRLFEQALGRHGRGLPVTLLRGRSVEAMSAADVVLTASGTATLEAMLLKRPMVVAYRMSPLSYALARCLVKAPHISWPNLLAGKALVPEFVQRAATPENLGSAVLDWLDRPSAVEALTRTFWEFHQVLRQGADRSAAQAVLEVIGDAA